MDFFQVQDTRRRESLPLLIAFVAVFTLCLVFTYYLSNTVSSLFGANQSAAKWLSFLGFVATIATGCYMRWRDVADGGNRLALRMGAKPIERASAVGNEKKLLNMVEELSVAAGITAPCSFNLSYEHSINAFVAGNKQSTILVVTKGALTHFNDDELRAVVAHEIGHIANNDLTISMSLLIALSGLNAITEAGYDCYAVSQLRTTTPKKQSNWFSSKQHDQNGYFAAVVVFSVIAGTILVVIGSVFTSLGNFMKSAFSRKREFLADAKGVQLTRDKWSMASALNTIEQENENRQSRLYHQTEISHMCINSPGSHWLFGKWLSTHPPIRERILSIDPYFDIKQRKKREQSLGESVPTFEKNQSSMAGRTTIGPIGDAITDTVSLGECSQEIALLLSLVIQKAGYNENSNALKYESTLNSYTSKKYPMRTWEEPNIKAEFEDALNTLLRLPVVQRQNLLDHIGELTEHDTIVLTEEKQLVAFIYMRLNPRHRAA